MSTNKPSIGSVVLEIVPVILGKVLVHFALQSVYKALNQVPASQGIWHVSRERVTVL